jgi:hypothetical protein
MGWFLCEFTMNKLFAFYLSKRGAETALLIVFTKSFWMQAQRWARNRVVLAGDFMTTFMDSYIEPIE